ncbi:MAG: GspH/FimT family pseudopilin [Gammaproteobacteria bacterium]|nr:GspH/FimT family pseudopilin [Gammaproteobacteria bacterium]
MTCRGFTLTELLAAVAVAAVLMAFAVPSLQAFLARERGTAAVNQLLGALATARAQAIMQRRVVTACPGRAGACLGRNQWHHGMLIFADDNGNGVLDTGERLMTALPALRDGERIYWRSFRNRSYLQFHPRGYTRWQNGSFLYCPPDQDAGQARMAIINAQGRVRMARDTDGDGIVENASGDPVVCPP